MDAEKKDRGPLLKWPWNILAYILLGIVLSILLSPLFGIPLTVLFVKYQKKKHPGMPEGGYCLARSRGFLKYLPWGLGFGALGGMMLWVIWYGYKHQLMLQEGQAEQIGLLVVGGVLLLLGVFLCFIAVRDSFFPEKSVLADSIRSQLPYPDEAPPVSELYAMVDKDLQENGITFGRVIVGKEWVLGDHASYIPRIRGVFGRDEIVMHHYGNKTTSSRVVELYIVDDRNQVMYSDVKEPNELPIIMDCLKLRAPYAYFGDYGEMSGFRGVSDEEKENRERKYRRRQADKELKDFQNPPEKEQKVILSSYTVGATSRVDEQAIREVLEGEYRRKGLVLTAGKPVFIDGVPYGALWCSPDRAEGTQLILEEYIPGATQDTSRKGLSRFVHSDQEAVRILLTWAEGRIDHPEQWQMGTLEQWGVIDLNLNARDTQRRSQERTHPGELRLVSSEGVGQTHYTFTREDVQVAAEGIIDKSYQTVRCVKKGGYLLMTIETGDKMDGRCTVVVSRPMEKELRFFENKCGHRQAADWLMEFYDGKFSPNWREWKDVTRKVTK